MDHEIGEEMEPLVRSKTRVQGREETLVNIPDQSEEGLLEEAIWLLPKAVSEQSLMIRFKQSLFLTDACPRVEIVLNWNDYDSGYPTIQGQVSRDTKVCALMYRAYRVTSHSVEAQFDTTAIRREGRVCVVQPDQRGEVSLTSQSTQLTRSPSPRIEQSEIMTRERTRSEIRSRILHTDKEIYFTNSVTGEESQISERRTIQRVIRRMGDIYPVMKWLFYSAAPNRQISFSVEHSNRTCDRTRDCECDLTFTFDPPGFRSQQLYVRRQGDEGDRSLYQMYEQAAQWMETIFQACPYPRSLVLRDPQPGQKITYLLGSELQADPAAQREEGSLMGFLRRKQTSSHRKIVVEADFMGPFAVICRIEIAVQVDFFSRRDSRQFSQ